MSCPTKGGDLTVDDYEEGSEMALYTCGHCSDCIWECCGGCI